MTVLIVVGAEILPKSLANANSESWALKSAGLLRMLMVILTPLLYLFDKLNSAIKKSTSRQSIDNTEPSVTEQELKFIVENIEEEGVLEKQEGELVRSALSFDEKTVQEILTPRVDLECIDINDPIEENIKWILGSRYSRIPVYEGDSDEIIGILHTRRFLCELIKDKTPDLRTLITPAFFVYKTKNLSSLLTDFKHNKMHIAVVTDDYGGTLGIVTMEDLLEQLVGDIWDEDEVEKPDYVQVDNNSYIVSGDMPIRDMFEILDINIDSMEYGQKTMGGLALEMFTYIPKVGESFKLMGLNVTIKKMKENRIIEMNVKMDNKE
jgi:CBS domain containing-hemolysin-like protein